MTDAKPRKRKITVVASVEGIERANKALLRHGHDSIAGFAAQSLVSRATITKFFNQQSIQVDSFKQICEELQLEDWHSIVQASTPGAVQQVEATNLTSEIDATLHRSKKPARQVTLSDPTTERKVVIVLEGDESSINNELKIILQLALQDRGITVKITDLESGSIRVSAEVSQDDIARLIELVQSGELTEIAGNEIKEVQVFQESLDDVEENEPSDKWKLVKQIRRTVEQKIKFSSGDIDFIDTMLSRADFSGAYFSGANLNGANLSGADLSGANLSDVILTNVDLSGADLRGADLSDADLNRAILINANLSGANLSDTILSDTNLIDANLGSADFSGVNFNRANLSFTNLSGADLSHARLKDALLSGADLSGANLSRADLIDANLSSANLSRANLNGADLSSADLSSANLSRANLNGADLSSADLSRANLRDTNLRDAYVAGAIFSGTSGISELLKQDLIQRGAIFEDSPGDRSRVLSRR